MKITAIFMGQDWSLGYRHGKLYHLNFNIHNGKIRIDAPLDSDAQVCDYLSLKTFINNWSVI